LGHQLGHQPWAPCTMIGFLPASLALSVNVLSLIAFIAPVGHAFEHSHRGLYKSHTDHADTTKHKHRGHNFTLVDRYEGKTFFECVWPMTSILCLSTLLM
jgi:hypothetical protein